MIEGVQQLGRLAVKDKGPALMVNILANLFSTAEPKLLAGHTVLGIGLVIRADEIIRDAITRHIAQHGQRGRKTGKLHPYGVVQNFDIRAGPRRGTRQ